MQRQEVEVRDISMPFLSMVIFMVKWAIASIPALIILGIVFSVLGAIFGGVLQEFGPMHQRL